MVTLETLRAERREDILRLAEGRGANSVRVFGSVARGEANENSDLDLLVAWEPGRSLMDHAGLVEDLQELLGIKVHIGTESSLHWYAQALERCRRITRFIEPRSGQADFVPKRAAVWPNRNGRRSAECATS
jgi:hypothetical protein